MEKISSIFFALALVATGIGFVESPNHYYYRSTQRERTSPSGSLYHGDRNGENKSQLVKETIEETAASLPSSQQSSDLQITRQVRQSIVEDERLSFAAEKVTIVTIKGVVTLMGSVNSLDEKVRLAEKARSIEGVSHIDNQLKVKDAMTYHKENE